MLSKEFKLYKRSEERSMFFELWKMLMSKTSEEDDEVLVSNVYLILAGINGFNLAQEKEEMTFREKKG
jgi:hypothetical protein